MTALSLAPYKIGARQFTDRGDAQWYRDQWIRSAVQAGIYDPETNRIHIDGELGDDVPVDRGPYVIRVTLFRGETKSELLQGWLK